MRFFQNVHGRRRALVADRFFLGRLGYGLIRKAGGLYVPALGSRRRNRRIISKSCAGHRAADALVPTGTIAVTRTARKSRRTQAIHVSSLVGVTFSRNAVGIAKSPGLHLFNGGFDRGGSGASRAHHTDFHVVLG